MARQGAAAREEFPQAEPGERQPRDPGQMPGPTAAATGGCAAGAVAGAGCASTPVRRIATIAANAPMAADASTNADLGRCLTTMTVGSFDAFDSATGATDGCDCDAGTAARGAHPMGCDRRTNAGGVLGGGSARALRCADDGSCGSRVVTA